MSPERAEIKLPASGKLALLGAGLLMVAMVVLLVAQLAILRDSREHIVAQDRKINRIVKGTSPVLDEVEPVADDARELLRAATPLAREATPLVREALPLVQDATALVRGFDTERLFQFVDLGTDLVEGLRDSAFIPRTLLAADLVPVMKQILAETLFVQRRTLLTQRRTLRVQRRTLAIQRQSRDIQQRTLAVQEEALVHIRSIDRKTGGPAPEPVPAPTGPVGATP